MSEIQDDRVYADLIKQITCNQKDPCAYDHTCSNHAVIWKIEERDREISRLTAELAEKEKGMGYYK